MLLRRTVSHNLIWNMLAMVSNQGTTFLVNVLLANILGRTVFGEFALLQNTQFTLTNVAQLATWFTASKYLAEFRLTDKARAGRILAICSRVSIFGALLTSGLLAASSPWLVRNAFAAPHLSTGLLITAATVIFSTINMFQLGALAGLESHRRLAQGVALGSLVYVAASIIAARLWGVNGAVMALFARFFLQWSVLHILLKRECRRQEIPWQPADLRSERRLLSNFSLPYAVTGSLSWPTLWLAATCLAQRPDGFDQLALYAASQNFRMLVLFLPFTITNFIWPILNRHRGLADAPPFWRLFYTNLLISGILTVSGASALALAGPWLLALFGKSFPAGQWVLTLMLVSTIPEALTMATQQLLYSREKSWLALLGMSLPRDVAIVASAWLLAPQLGAAGVALALLIGWSAALVSSGLLGWITRSADHWQPAVVQDLRQAA